MQKSIRQDLSIRIGGVILAISMVIGAIYYVYSIRYQEKEFKDFVDHQTDQICDTFTLQLWLFDLSSTRKLCKMFSESPTVSGLRLLDHNRKVVFEKNASPEEEAVHINKKLLHEGEKLVGYVDIYFSNTAWKRHRANMLTVGVLMALATMLGAFFFINILLKRYLSKPLEDLQTDMITLSQGDFQESNIVGQKAEIQKIIDAFNDMAIKLQQRDEALKNADKKLRLSEERYRSLTDDALDTSTVGIFILDRDFKVVWVNQAVEDYFGLKRNEIIGRDKRQLIRERIVDIFENPDRFINKVLTTYDKNSYNERFECHVLPDDGREERWLEHRSQPIQSGLYAGGRIEHYYDITDMKQAQKALQESEHKFREMANLLPQVVYEADLQGNLTFVNEQAYNLLGYSKEDIDKGINVFQLLISEDRDKAKENIRKIVSGDLFKSLESKAIRKDGSSFSVIIYSAPITKESKTVGLRGIIVDISQRKQMEEKLLKGRKLESVGVLAGGIAHDFNNILAVILGNISLALMTADPQGEIHTLLVETEKATLRAQNLTQQLLTFAKGGEPVKKIASIDRVIRDSARFVLSGSNVRCDFKFGQELWPVAIDTGQISQVIQNMIANASQAMPTGGTIAISCSNCCLELNDKIPLSPGNYIQIVVKDQGVGIPADQLDKIFDPYFTTKQESSGLGLAITHSIINKHHGYIGVDSEPGQGATFTIYLPASNGRPELEQRDILASPGIEPGKIMIMDDEKMIRSLVEKALSRKGYEVVSAEEGDEAVELYKKAEADGTPIGLIIMDLTIPGGVGGRDAVKKIHEINPAAKVLVSSGYSNDPVMADFSKYGFCGALVKPFQITELIEIVGKIMSN